MEYPAQNFKTMTEQIKLTKELVTLVHFVELNESGWVKKTLGKIVLSVLARSAQGLTAMEIQDALQSDTSHDFGLSQIKKLAIDLVSQGQIVDQGGGRYRIRESVLNGIKIAVAQTQAEEEETKLSFIRILNDFSPDMDGEKIWIDFIELFLTPLIREAGANTLNLLSGAAPLVNHENLQSLLDSLPIDDREAVRRTVVEFLDPSVQAVRQFILKRTAASFFVAAVSLDASTVEALDKKRNTKTSIRLFLDTNTLFSVLELHENDGNDGAMGLMALNADPKAPVKVKLFVFPETIDEAVRVLSNAANSMGTRPYAPQLAQAALRANLSGVHAKYLEAASKSAVPLSPKEYFAPYIQNLGSILKMRGIETIDRSLLVSRQDQEIIDDVLDNQKYEERLPPERRKPYEALFHDVYSWHCIYRQRPLNLTSVLEAKEWFVTLDRRLIGFDAFKGKGKNNWIPTCIDPSTFIQYAQFWTPRSEQFEKALFGSLRLPLLFGEFDSHTEDVSLAIINRLSRIEAIGDFTAEELHTLLLDDAVRTRFRESDSDIEQTEIVRDELLAIHKSTVSRADQLAAAVEEGRIVQQRQQTENVGLKADLQKTYDDLKNLKDLQKDQQEIRRFAVKYLIVPFSILSLFFVGLGWILFGAKPLIVTGLLLSFAITGGIAKLKGKNNMYVEKSFWLRHCCNALVFSWAAGVAGVGATLNALYGNYLQSNQEKILDNLKSQSTFNGGGKPLETKNDTSTTELPPK